VREKVDQIMGRRKGSQPTKQPTPDVVDDDDHFGLTKLGCQISREDGFVLIKSMEKGVNYTI
jgi:hypothetical protein